MSLLPADANTGIEFVRRDANQCNNVISARWDNVSCTELSTTISNDSGIRISSTEHLMAALYAAGVDNARVVIDSPELPIMDGSAAPFIKLIQQSGLVEQKAERNVVVVNETVSVTDDEAHASLTPSTVPWMDMSIEFSEHLIGRQRLSLPFSTQTFCNEVADARTFGFEKDLQALKRRGFARGSSLDNVIVVANNKVVNCEGLRYADEFVRHKLVDAVGDLALAGYYLIGHFKGHRSGHKLNNALLHQLFRSRAWSLVPISTAHDAWSRHADGQTLSSAPLRA